MKIDIVTLFPEMVAAAIDYSIVKRARERGLVTIRVVDLRDYTFDRHRTADDVPYGGGGGMVMKIEPIARALADLTGASSVAAAPDDEAADDGPLPETRSGSPSSETIVGLKIEPGVTRAAGDLPGPRVALTDPRGPRFTQETARRWAREPHLILLCGHYEGVDERVRRHLVTDEVSIGDYVLTGGELPALVVVDALTRLQPGALGDADATDKDTFSENLLEHPHYTRPLDYNGWRVPEILQCGHHAEIERWRRWHRLHATRERRPDLFERLELENDDLKLLAGPEPTAPPDPKAERRLKASIDRSRLHPKEAGIPTALHDGTEDGNEEIHGTGTGNNT